MALRPRARYSARQEDWIIDQTGGRPEGRVTTRLAAAFPVLVMIAASTLELALADRKFGLFSGGFGMSRAIAQCGELAQFLAGYALAQGFAGLAAWIVAARLTRGRPAWKTCFVFGLFATLFCGLLAVQYQLYSYFSDAVSFALIRRLGGGSLLDALLFASNEIATMLLVLAAIVLAAWLVWRLGKRFLRAPGIPAPVPRARWLALLAIAFVAAAFALARSGSDAPYGLARTLSWSALTGVLNLASDVDGDGYGLFEVRHDGAPLDPARHPLALDIPGNGVDEDGYGGDLVLVSLPRPLPAQRFAGERPNVVLVVLESTRFDVLGKRVGGKLVAPNLEALAAAGDVARPAYSHVGFTTESLKSIFSGRLVPHRGDPSLFTDLDASGYTIGVFSGQPEDFGGISETVGMRASADVFVDAQTLQEKRAFSFASQGSLLVDEEYLMAGFDTAFGTEQWAAPHFLYFNFQSAHFPYFHEGMGLRLIDHPLARDDISEDHADAVQAAYWNAVANADAWLGALITRLKARGEWDSTLLLVTGDHGEDLFEDGFLGHGHLISRRQNATLLVSNRPGSLPDAPVGLSDYRGIIAAAIRGAPPPEPAAAPFMHVGPLNTPTAIGLAGDGGRLTSLRLDTGLACFLEQHRCAPYKQLRGTDLARADALVARWGSERWREHGR